MFYNDWLTYDLATAWSQQGGKFGEYRGLTDMWINHYPYEDYKPTTYQDALIRQCKAIAENFKPAIFVSGGVDSHAAALGFKWADVGADFVHVRNSFNGHTCEVEWEFTKAFAKKHDIVVIEDSAQCVMGSISGRLVGTLGDMSSVIFKIL